MKDYDREKLELAGCLAFPALIPVIMVYQAFVLTMLWEWFVVPTFGVSVLTLIPAMGIILVVRYLNHGKPSEADTVQKMYVLAFAKPLYYLIVGYLVQLFL